MARDKGPDPGANDPGRRNRGRQHLTGSERAQPKRTYDPDRAEHRTGPMTPGAGDRKGKGRAETYRPRAEQPVSGATATERMQGKKGFNPAWLLVPAAGLLLGGLGIANMNREPKTPQTTAPGVTDTQPVAPVATTTTSPAGTACKIAFSETTIQDPVSRIKNTETDEWLNAPSGKQYVVVNTTASNTGAGECKATPANQRGYTDDSTYFNGNAEAGDALDRGRLMTKAVAPDKTVDGAYVFEIPNGSGLTKVGLRADGSEKWTTVRK